MTVPVRPTPAAPRGRDTWFAAALLAAAGLAAYHNCFHVPFVFDDALAIVENPTIRRLASWDILRPPAGQGLTVEGRPLLNLSLALNHAAGGTAVFGFHAVNLAIHIAAALALCGLTRITLGRPAVPESLRVHAAPLALAIALLWLVHPLQTESVTYVIQRAESLMGLFFLAALYAFARGADGGGPRWFAAAALAAWCGAATKEVAAAIPALALLYDRTFFAGSFRGAWRARRGAHLALMSAWLLSALLVGDRGGTFGRVPWTTFALTQFDALARYVQLSFWPHPLVFDYGVQWTFGPGALVPGIVLVTALLAGTALALRRWPAWGFLGLWFLAPLAPTSLLPGNRQTISEHRLYLPLAALIVAAVIVVFLLLRHRRAPVRLGAVLLVAASLGVLTVRRNHDYRTAIALYTDTAVKRPGNAFAHYNLAKALAESGAPAAALPAYAAALRLEPGMTAAHFNLGNALAALGRLPDAVAAFEAALRTEPTHANAHYNLGNVLRRLGRLADARDRFATAARLAPGSLAAHANLGGVLLELGQHDAARAALERALALDPADAAVLVNLGTVHRLAGRTTEARGCFERALAADPAFAPARGALRALGPPQPETRPP